MFVEFNETPETSTLTVPYRPGGTGSSNQGYFDLLVSPSAIDKIKELVGFPNLKDLVMKINSPKSQFVTFRTDTVVNFYVHLDFTRSVASFLTIACREPDPEDRDFWMSVAEDIADRGRAAGLGSEARLVCFLTPFTWKAKGVQKGWCLDIYNQGYGYNEYDAWLAWKKLFGVTADAIENAERILNNANG